MHRRFPSYTADIEVNQFQPFANRNRPIAPRIRRMKIELAAIAAVPHQPIRNGAKPAWEVWLNTQ
jgi:hypothetical protein